MVEKSLLAAFKTREWPAVRASLGRPLAVYAASRAVVLLTALAAVSGSKLGLLRSLVSWDGAWYLTVTVFGYPSALVNPQGTVAGAPAFFPLYPLAIRLVAWLTGLTVVPAAVLVANIGGAAAVVLLRELTRRVVDAATADRTVVLFSFFPGAVVLSMAYAEGLTLSLCLACLLALQQRSWAAAGATGALATLARPNAVAVCAACFWEAARVIHSERSWQALVAPLLAPAGFAVFMVFLWRRTGEPTAWFFVQRRAWLESLDFGVTTVRNAVSATLHPGANLHFTLTAAALVVTGVMLAALLVWRPPGYLVVYALTLVGLTVASVTLGLRPRFLLTAFPLIMAAAHYVRGPLYVALVGLSTGGLIALTVLYAASLGPVP
ncbi:MAG: mannosyltransferase family protein [Nitriliruptorales bacterium]